MTPLLALACAAASSAYATSPSLSFPPAQLSLPPLSLAKAACPRAAGPSPRLGNAQPFQFSTATPSRPQSRMPIIQPREIDGKMVLKPSERIHYALIIKLPAMSSDGGRK